MTIRVANEKTTVGAPAKIAEATLDRTNQCRGGATASDVRSQCDPGCERACARSGDREVLVTGSLDAGGGDRARTCDGQVCRGHGHRVLLVFNAALSYFQEGRAQSDACRIEIATCDHGVGSTRRDLELVPAAELVPGDAVKLNAGGAGSPADAKIQSGEVLLDQSLLTGDSAPVEAGDGAPAYAGALIRRGEAIAEVSARARGRSLAARRNSLRAAHVVSTQQSTVFRVVRNIAAFNGVSRLGADRLRILLQMPIAEIVSLILTAVLASIPVALPATFTLAAALGARNLAKLGVLPTRLSAVDEAGTMDVLCADKTGTLTRNELLSGRYGRWVRSPKPMCSRPPHSQAPRRTRSGGPRYPRGRCRERRRRQIQIRLLRALRSGQAHVGGNGYGLERRDAPRREGRVRNRDRPR